MVARSTAHPYLEYRRGLGVETVLFPADDPKKITPLLTGPANDVGQVFSPDSRWIAFTSNRSGRQKAISCVFAQISRRRRSAANPSRSQPMAEACSGGDATAKRC